MSNIWTIRWIRRFFRRRMNPVPVDKAHLWKRRFALTYMVLAWNAFGFVVYMMMTGRSDWAKHYGYKTESDGDLSPGRKWARTLNIENATVIRISGLSVTSAEDAEEGNEEQQKNSE